MLTLAMLRSLRFPVHITAVDLSAKSVTAARKAITNGEGRPRDVTYTQGDVLSLPFADNSFDLVVTSGALEYVPLEDGLIELARVIAPDGHLLHLPVRPSFISTLLEICFRFKAHHPRSVQRNTRRHFRVVNHYRFHPHQAIGWTKTALLAQKV